MNETPLFGLRFFAGTMDEAAQAALALIRARRGAYAVTPNPEIVLRAEQDPALFEALQEAALCLPDGVGLVWASYLAGKPLDRRLPGIDFAAALMEKLAAERGRVYLLGARPGVAERAADRLREKYQGLTVAGARHGYFTEAEEARAIEEIAALRPELVLVCLGSPRQELWMRAQAPALGAGLLVGLGGALDVFSGKIPRAPAAWQRLGLEWLYRLLREPKRIARVWRLPAIFRVALQERNRRNDCDKG